MPLPVGDKKQTKIDKAKEIFDKQGIIYTEMQSGQFQIDKINYWSTTEKWYDQSRNARGVGLNSFIKHLKDNNII